MPVCMILPTPVVLMKIPSAQPFGTTLVSPQTILAPEMLNSFAMLLTIVLSLSISKPSSIITLQLKYCGCAPIIAKSFTVPAMANLPMLPPAKNNGDTVNESVVKAVLPSRVNTAASSSLRKMALSNALKNKPLISLFIS